MREDIRRYARLGLVHHMLYPKCMEDPDDHVRTLLEFVRRADIETLECCLPYGTERRRTLIPAVRGCGKQDVAFALHLFPLRKLSFTTPAPHEQAQVRMIVADMIECAVAIGAAGLVFASGGPPPDQATDVHLAAFADFCRWLCAEVKTAGMTAMLEPFDTSIDKKYLYGPTTRCVALIESLAPQVDNLGIELDMAHVPLMGESFEDAIRTAAPHLKRVHLGNCILKDSSHPLYGDKHPPIGLEGGEVDVPQLAGILRCLLDVGFLSVQERGSLVIEMTPWPGKTAQETIRDAWERLDRAWRDA